MKGEKRIVSDERGTEPWRKTKEARSEINLPLTIVCRAALTHAQPLQMEGRMLGRRVGGSGDGSLCAVSTQHRLCRG